MTIGEWIDHAIRAEAASREAGSQPGPRDPSPSPLSGPALAGGRPPISGVSAGTVDAVFGRIDDGGRVVEARLRPIGFALKNVAERLVVLERRAKNRAEARPTRFEPSPPSYDFPADPIGVSATGLAEHAAVVGSPLRARAGRRLVLLLIGLLAFGGAGVLGWTTIRQGELSLAGFKSAMLSQTEAARSALERALQALDIDTLMPGADLPATEAAPSPTVTAESRPEQPPSKTTTASEQTTRNSTVVEEAPSGSPKTATSEAAALPLAEAPDPTASRPVAPPPAPSLFDPPSGSVSADSSASTTARAGIPPGVRARADAGDPAAQFQVAVVLLGAVPPVPAEAAVWFREAAINGLAVAQFNLGAMYERGFGTAKDETRALLWYHSAAEQGFAPAQYNLGRLYAEGIGIPRSDTEARRWLQSAADGGVVAGLLGLAAITDDSAEREKLMLAAAGAGSETARDWLRTRNDGIFDDVVPGPSVALILDQPDGAVAVADIQRALRDRGYYDGRIDGIAGPPTRTAIRRFQADNGLPETGLPSVRLQRLLN